MSFELKYIISFSVTISMVIGWLRFHKTQPAFSPFIYLMTFGFLHELISVILIKRHYSNAAAYNLYTLIEALLILWQFRKWRSPDVTAKSFPFFLSFFVGIWLVENFWISSIQLFNSYFILAYSFLTIFFTIKTLNSLIVEIRAGLLRNATFLICLGFLIYFTYSIMVETFWMYGLNRDPIFQSSIYNILVVVNLVANLIYALAALWMPTKPKFILLS